MRYLQREIVVILTLITLIACSKDMLQADYQVIPLPQEIHALEGEGVILKDGVQIVYPQNDTIMKYCAESLCRMIQERTGLQLVTNAEETLTSEQLTQPRISLLYQASAERAETYRLNVTSEKVVIEGTDPAGVYHGIQTLFKSLPIGPTNAIYLPSVQITDWPQFQYRGMMLDVSRHFFSTQEVKEFIDLLALHQMNVFHWHLTDDQGWRIQIKRYPELTRIGSKRSQTVIGRNTDEYDGLPYGGFYTQEEIRDIVNYASEHFITIIPEIDMPGHMMGALSAMPELGCTGGPYQVWERWGVSDDVLCVGNPETLKFVKNVLDEVMTLFPSPYIHLGGDECLKTHWRECPKCQKAIRQNGLTRKLGYSPEDLLQNHFMTAVEQHLQAHGRRMIGWDEILEGNLSESATVMAWRGAEKGIEAARRGHDVIMSPTSHFYFDFYQSQERELEPLAIGGYLPLEQVYSFETTSLQMSDEEREHLLGVQANVWTEYIIDNNHLQYMILPRMDALSEVQWCKSENKNYQQFLKRLTKMMTWYDYQGINHADHLLGVRINLSADPKQKAVQVTLSSMEGAQIRYTLDGSDPLTKGKIYTEPFYQHEDANIQAIAIHKDKIGRLSKEKIHICKSSYHPIELQYSPNSRFTYQGASQLVDGILGDKSIISGRWLGFIDNDVVATIDLEKVMDVRQVCVGTVLSQQDWVFDARLIKVKLSQNGEDYQEVASMDLPAYTLDDTDGRKSHELHFAPQHARYVKVTIRPEKSIASCHCGKGSKGFVFVDEIEVD